MVRVSELVALCLLGAIPPAAPNDAEWRSAKNDGVNCGFVMLRCHGKEVSFSDWTTYVQELGKEPSLLDIKKGLQHFEVNVEIVRCRPDDLLLSRTPAIVVLNDVRTNKAELAIVIERDTRDFVTVLYGGFAILKKMPWDDFITSWTGVAISPMNPARGASSSISLWVISATIILGLLACYRRKRK